MIPQRVSWDAAAGLDTLASGGTLDLDAAGRARAAKLAALEIKDRSEEV